MVTNVAVSTENAQLVREVDSAADDGHEVLIITPRAIWNELHGGEKRQALSRAFDLLREAGCSVRVLAPDGTDVLSGA